MLASAYGPNSTLFARSASVRTTYEHPPHVHIGGSSRCQLDERGWINFRIPVNVSLDLLGEEYFSCEEPPGTTLWPELARAVAP